jgi:hypothetical protein
MSEETFDQVFQIPGPAKLIVKNIRGSVEIHPGEDGVIQVKASKKANTGDEKRTEIELTQETDGTVTAATRFPDSGWNWMFGSHPCEVDYVIKAPRQCSLKLSGVSNTVLAEGFEGDASVNTVSGEVTLRDLKSSLRIHTVSGDVTGERLSGSLDVDTVSGDVTLKGSDLKSIRTNSVSGDMRIATPLSDGLYNFKSVSGDVHLTLPVETHCTAELHSVSGDVVSAFPVSGLSHHHGSQTIIVQGGGARVSMNSVSGDLSLDCDGEIPPAAKPNETTASEENRTILEQVERGELTVDEALVRLQQ